MLAAAASRCIATCLRPSAEPAPASKALCEDTARILAIVQVAQGRIQQEQEPLVDRMCELRAVTREGQAARARSLALWDAEMFKREPACTNERFTEAIVRDLLAVSAAA